MHDRTKTLSHSKPALSVGVLRGYYSRKTLFRFECSGPRQRPFSRDLILRQRWIEISRFETATAYGRRQYHFFIVYLRIERVACTMADAHEREAVTVSFRFTDLHQPDVAGLLRIPVPPRPERFALITQEGNERVQEVEAGLVTPDCVQECLNLLRAVDLRFLDTPSPPGDRGLAFRESTEPYNRRSDLVRLFKQVEVNIFESLTSTTNSSGEGNRELHTDTNARVNADAANTSKRQFDHVKMNSPVAVEKKRRARGTRVRVRSTGKAAPTAEEETKKSLEGLMALFDSFNASFGDVYLSDARQVLRDVQSLATAAFGVRPAALVQIPKDVLFSVMQNLGRLVRDGARVKLYTTLAEGSELCIRAESVMEAVVLAERLILKANSAESRDFVIPEETLHLCVDATRFHLHNNVLPFYCSRIESAVRPDLHDDAPVSCGVVQGMGGRQDDTAAGRHTKEPCRPRNSKTKQITLTTKKNRGSERGDRGETSNEGNNQTKASVIQMKLVVERLKDRVLASLDAITDIVAGITIQTSTLTPLVRTATQALTVDRGVADVHTKCVAVLSAIHGASEELRPTILPDIFGALVPHVGVGKRYKREVTLVVEDGRLMDVGILSALALALVQNCAYSASMTSCEMQARYSSCIATADRFWELCMEQLGSAKTMRSETDIDFIRVMTGITQDLLDISDSRYWACASTILIRLVSRLNGPAGLRHPDSAIRQLCVDICGRILAHLHKDSALLNESSEYLQGILDVTANNGTIAEAAPGLLLSSLTGAAGSSGGSRSGEDTHKASLAMSSARFMLLRKISKDLIALDASHDDQNKESKERFKEEVAELLRDAQEVMSGQFGHSKRVYRAVHLGARPPGAAGLGLDSPGPLDRNPAAISEEDLSLLMKVVIHEEFLSAAPVMLTWLVEILESKLQSPSTRAKAVKAIGDVVAVDKRLLDAPSLLAAVEHALQDDSISVREAALVLVGKHMVQDPALAVKLIHIVIRASEDAGSSVRKSAIKILRDCCLIMPEERSDKIIESYKAILNRSSDSEESVKSFVVKIFRSLWFDAASEGDDILVQRSPQDRAKSLATLTDAIVGLMPSSGCRALIDQSNPLIVLLREIRDADQQGTATVLLTLFVYGSRVPRKETGDTRKRSDETCAGQRSKWGTCPTFDSRDSPCRLSYLHAIYALAVANPASCIPDNDPLKFLRTLAPHVKEDPLVDTPEKEDTRMNAEETLYILGITSTILNNMERMGSITVNLATDISEELPNIINKHKFTAVVSAACACLSSCALSSPTATGRLLNVAAQYLAFLEKPGTYMKNLPRFIFIVGQVYRHASRLMQQVEVFLPDQPALADKLTPASCIVVLNGFWTTESLSGIYIGSPALEAQITRSALEAICQVMIAAPLSHVDGKSIAQQAISRALSPDSTPPNSLVALNGLIELIQTDALELHRRQDRNAAKGTVAAENGEGDVSQSSAILQLHWDAILSLALKSSGMIHSNEDQTAIMIRRKILFLIEISIRDGLCGPWSCLSTLVFFAMTDGSAGALSQDPSVSSLCSRSVKQLKLLVVKYPHFVDMGRIITGIKDSCPAAPRQKNGRQKEQAITRLKVAQQRAKRIYSEIVCSTRAKRNEFLRLLVRSFKGDRRSDLSSAKVDLCCWLAIILAGIPYKKAEEICLVLQEIDTIASSRTSSTVADLHELLDVEQSMEEEGFFSSVGVKDTAKRKDSGVRGDENGDGDGDNSGEKAARLLSTRSAVLNRAAVLCVMARLKSYLMCSYNIPPERQAVYATSKASERSNEKDSSVTFNAKAGGDALANLYGVYGVTSLSTSALIEELDADSHFV